ncbi:Mycolic acid-containing lipids exporter MmpL11 [Frankliniella fusca]|uniref:Mycolic acid-containing lipids exporter MmpL11 n=1 Tax=Frankliniella fusca TaxID=407009 RepID=A0AAE1LGF9_9NEOP|nr:Mycolic acid-containing lipids exporter MmpL11 [Frankliniella fusca]
MYAELPVLMELCILLITWVPGLLFSEGRCAAGRRSTAARSTECYWERRGDLLGAARSRFGGRWCGGESRLPPLHSPRGQGQVTPWT